MGKINLQKQLDPVIRPATDCCIAATWLTLLDDFHRERISYCCWKSSRTVRHVLTGDGDLDLLIAKTDQHRCEAILLARGLKLFPSAPGRDHPSMLSFLGYDEASGQLLHLHLHFRLLAGERLLKNYVLPWEDVILARAITHPTLPIKILDPASEAVLLVIRSCLELRRRDPVTLRHWAATTRKFALDRKALAAHIDRAALYELAAELMGDELAAQIVQAFYAAEPPQNQGQLRRHIERHLAPYRTYAGLEMRVRTAGRAALWAGGGLNKQFFHLPRPWSRRAPGGGAVVAIIGIDGSGKSTVVAAIRAWLGSEIDVIPIYFGTGDGRPSLLLRPLKMMVPLATRILGTRPKGASHGKISDRPPGRLYRGLLTVWALAVAYDKRGKLLSARRGANRGLIVLTDRYPQSEIIGFNDGPLLTRLTGTPQWLRRLEASVYHLAHRLPPDLVIKLQVTPQTAQRREPDMNLSVIRERIEAIPQLTFLASRMVSVDAERPLDDVLRVIKTEIWALL